MPRVKKNPETVTVKKSKPVKKKAPKKIAPKKKKAQPVMVDVIEDEETSNFFPDLPQTATMIEETEEMMSEDSLDSFETPEDQEELDKQKKFFSELVTEIKDKKESRDHRGNHLAEKNQAWGSAKSVNLYRRLVWRFIAFTAVLLLIVFYFSFSKLTIAISPKGETLSDNLLLKVQPLIATSTEENENDFREEVEGSVVELSLTEEKTFPATGEEFVGEEIAGQVSVINNSAKAQPLVATTRILSPDNKLYRLKEAVNVPAGGEVTVDIYVEKPSEDLAIRPTTFTIPGLWLGLQDKIYAKSTEAFSYRQKVKKYIKASDIDRATKEMSDLLLQKAKANQKTLAGNEEVIYESLGPVSFEISAKAGETKDEFTVKAQATILAIKFSKKEVAKLTAAKLALVVPDDKELVEYSADNIVYSFDNYDTKTGVATIKASFGGTMVLKGDTEIIDRKQLVNLNRAQLEDYLKTFPEIKSYELKFSPSFINHAPRLPERINIEIKGLER